MIFLRRLVVKAEHRAIIIKYLAKLRRLGIKIFVFYGGPSMADVEIFKNFTDTVNLQNLGGSFAILDHPSGKLAVAAHIRAQMKKFGEFIDVLNFCRQTSFVLATNEGHIM